MDSIDVNRQAALGIGLRRRWTILAALVAAVLLSGVAAVKLASRELDPATVAAPSKGEAEASNRSANSPAIEGWAGIQQRFGLSNVAVHNAIELLSNNMRFGPAEPRHNLSAHPAQIERAFALIARQASQDLGSLKSELVDLALKNRSFADRAKVSTMSGAYEDILVLYTIERLLELQHDMRVRELVAMLREPSLHSAGKAMGEKGPVTPVASSTNRPRKEVPTFNLR